VLYAISLRQTSTPDQLLGRVNASYRFLSFGAIPLGATLHAWAVAAPPPPCSSPGVWPARRLAGCSRMVTAPGAPQIMQ
jgi:hypothetical protein